MDYYFLERFDFSRVCTDREDCLFKRLVHYLLRFFSLISLKESIYEMCSQLLIRIETRGIKTTSTGADIINKLQKRTMQLN